MLIGALVCAAGLAQDVTPPTVTSTVPGDGTTVSFGPATITVNFDEQMDPATITESTIRLVRAGGDGSFIEGNKKALAIQAEQCIMRGVLWGGGKRMVRSVGVHLVFPAVLCFATNSLAADTDMLHVKSFPSGATVMIDGKERGQTPVLVRDLPAGDISVRLRIAGALRRTQTGPAACLRVAMLGRARADWGMTWPIRWVPL
jgi:methionine-rich copper-binding protein CopC